MSIKVTDTNLVIIEKNNNIKVYKSLYLLL